MDMGTSIPPCPDRPAALRAPGAGKPVSWPIRLFDAVQARTMRGMIDATDAQIISFQTPIKHNRVTRAIFGDVAPGVVTHDAQVPGPHRLDIRFYEAPGRPKPARAILYMHGGGWVFGEISLMDGLCSRLAARTGMLVASLGYRLAPANPFPAALEDCYTALCWLHAQADARGIDAARIGVAGESAGGNLAAALCLLNRARGGPAIASQTLIYPALDLGSGSPSRQENADAPILNPRAMAMMSARYLGPAGDAADPLVSPLRAPSLAGLPPALIQLAEHDPLRDDGWRYAARLEAAGVKQRTTEYPGAAHGFVNFPGLCPRIAARALDEIATYHGADGPR